jgi:hypothetical protein
MRYVTNLLNDLQAKPANLTTSSKYTELNGIIYFVAGALLVVWPGVTQVLFMERAFVGDEQALMRVIGLALGLVGWLLFFGGRSGGEQVAAATVIDRLIFVPLVLVPIVISGVFPRLFLAVVLLDVSLAIGAWVIISRRTPSNARHTSPV